MRLRVLFLVLVCLGFILLNALRMSCLMAYASVPAPQKLNDVKTIQLIVRQSFGDADPHALPFYRVAESLLRNKGFRVVDAKATQYDAQLLIMVEGTACAGRYQGGLQYSGAQICGKLTLDRDGESLWTGGFEGNVPPAEIITKRYKRPSDAPFDKAFDECGFELIVRSLAFFLGDETSLREITEALGDRRAVIRSKALEILSMVRVSETLPAVLAKLKDADPGVRLNAVKALSVYEQEEIFSPVLSMLTDEDINVRREAARVLGQIRDSRAVTSLIKLLKNDAFIRVTVKNSLIKIGEPSVEPLIAFLQEKNINPLAREEAVDILGEIKDPRAIALLIQALGSNDRWEQRKAVEAIYSMGKTAVSQLIVVLKDSNPMVRRSAIEILGRLKSTEALGSLLQSLNDLDIGVRYQAAWALGELGDRSALQPLEHLASSDPDESVRQMAVDAAKRIINYAGLFELE